MQAELSDVGAILGVLFGGVPIIGIIIYWGLFWSPLILGKLPCRDM